MSVHELPPTPEHFGHDSIELLLGEIAEIGQNVVAAAEPTYDPRTNTNRYHKIFSIPRGVDASAEDAQLVLYKFLDTGKVVVVLSQHEHEQTEITAEYKSKGTDGWLTDIWNGQYVVTINQPATGGDVTDNHGIVPQDYFRIVAPAGSWEFDRAGPQPNGPQLKAISEFAGRVYVASLVDELGEEAS